MLYHSDLVKLLAEHSNISNTAAKMWLADIADVISSILEHGDDVRISGLGTFSSKQMPERKGINPATGEKITIAACRKVKFTPAKELKARVK